MDDRVRDTAGMIAGMDPVQQPGTFVFALSDDPTLIPRAVATMQEAEGLSLILPTDVAQAAGLTVDLPMVWITLRVVSALDGVGLTAAVSTTLADAGIACNVVAAFHHDHVFVPAADAARAMELLRARARAEQG